MAGKELKYTITTDASQGVKGLKDFSSAAKRAMQEVEDSTEGTTTSAQKLAAAYSKVADELEADLKGAATAAEALGQALGPDLAKQADLGRVVDELHKMGLSFEEITADADVLAASLKKLDRVQKIKIEADDQATDDIRDAKRAADDLDGEEVNVKVTGEGLDELTDKLGELPGMLGTVGQAMGTAGLAGAAGAAATALGAAAISAADMAIEAKVTADLTGATVDSASRLQGVWTSTGADVNDLNDVLLQMNGVLETTPGLAEQIGVNLADGRNIVERFVQVVQLLDRSMLPPAQKAQLMSQLFGEEGVRQVQRMTTLVGDIGTAMAEMDETRVVSDEDVAAAEEMKRQFAEMTTLAQGLVAELGQEVVPLLGDAVGLLIAANDAKNSIEDNPLTGAVFKNFMPGLGQLTTRLDQARWVWDHTFGRKSDIQVSVADNLVPQVEKATRSVDDLNVALLKIRDPHGFQTFHDQWQTVLGDLADGKIESKEAADAVAFLMEALQLKDPSEVLALGVTELERLGDQAKKTGKDAALSAEDIKEATDAISEWAQKSIEGQAAVDALAGSFEILGRKQDALSSVFALGNAPLEFLGDIRDIDQAIRDFADFVKTDLKGAIPNIFNPDDVNADDFLAKIESLRGPIQAQITSTFAARGADAAKQTADNYVNELFNALGGRLSKDQIRELLGISDLDVKLNVAVNNDSVATAKAMLQVLTGLGGETPWTAQIELDLAAGRISGDAAKVLIANKLGKDFAVDVDAKLLPPSGQSMTAAKSEAEAWSRGSPAGMTTETLFPQNIGETHREATQWMRDNPLYLPVYTFLKSLPFGLADAGGTIPAGGGIVAEKGPEILNGRYLAVTPTVVPPGTRVTSRKRTAHILRTRGVRGLRRYDSGGVVAGPTSQTLNIHVNTSAIGNRYDLMRVVEKAGRDKLRLLGSRG